MEDKYDKFFPYEKIVLLRTIITKKLEFEEL